MQDLWRKIEPHLLNVEKPSRYFSLEDIPLPKKSDIKVCFIYPDTAEVGLSNSGLAILFNVLSNFNRRTKNEERRTVYVDFAFAPWFDMEEVLRKNKIELFSYFNNVPLREFDILGFSLPHELCYTNILNIIDLAGLKIKSIDRKDKPLIIAGGSGAYNPSVLEEYIDAFVIGDGEDVIAEIVQDYNKKADKKNNLKLLSEKKGIYVPGFNKGAVKRVSAFKEKRVFGFIPRQVHEHASIEIMRGCSAGCRFCQAGFINRPVREKNRNDVEKESNEVLSKTGYDKLSLLSLSTSDYSAIAPLSKKLADEYLKDRISLNMPSLRMDSFSLSIATSASGVKKGTLTFAPEAGNQRLRNAINKNVNEDQIIETVITAFKQGFSKFKLYFMIGFPDEKLDDLKSIIDIVNKIRSLARDHLKGSYPRITVNVSSFVPKPHTPMQWAPQIDKEEIKQRQKFLRDELKKIRDVDFRYHNAKQSVLEGLVSRGDNKIGKLIEEAWRAGCRFDSWTEFFKPEEWDKAVSKIGLDVNDYLKEKKTTDNLPWENIKSKVSKKYLISEFEKYFKSELTVNCREECHECGVCPKGSQEEKKSQEARGERQEKTQEKKEKTKTKENNGRQYKYKLTFSKKGKAKYLGHLEYVGLITRALRRSGLPLIYTKGFNPRPRLSFSQAVSLGKEIDDFEVTIRLSEERNISEENINMLLPEYIELKTISRQ